MKNKAGFLQGLFEQIESQVQFGDNKASLLVAGDAILLAISGSLIKLVSGCRGNDFTVDCMVPSVNLGLAAISAILLLWSLACSLLAVRPANIHNQPPPEFFLLSHIARTNRAEFIKSYRDISLEDLQEEALISIHGKARYATEKFRWLRRAVNTTLLSVGFMFVTWLVAIASRIL